MASNTEKIGSRGRIRVNVDQVSQDLVKNTSIVRVRGYVWITSGKATDNSGKCKAQITGTNSTDNIVVNGSYSSAERLIFDQNFTVAHDSDGTKTVTYKFTFGPSTSSYLGKGGSTSASLALTLIPIKPSHPLNIAAVLATTNVITVSYGTPISNVPILEYQIAYAKTNNLSGATVVSAGTSLNKTFSDLDRGSTYYFWARARNAAGFGEWTDSVNKTLFNVPDKMAIPGGTFTSPATVTITFNPPPSDGGTTVTGYDVQYSTSSDYAQPITKNVTASPVVFNNLTPTAYYFRVRAKNAIGDGPWSDNRVVVMIGGPKIDIDGTYYPSLAFVKYNGVYQPAIPYVRSGGVWRVAGG